jgi:hypothetical protein
MPNDRRDDSRPPEYAVFTEMVDASKTIAISDARDAPSAAAIQIARFLTEFEASIDDDRRALLIAIGGGLLLLSEGPADLEDANHD